MGVITGPTFTTGAIPTTANWQAYFDTLYDEFNGQINSDNIKAGGIINADILDGTIDADKLASPFSLPAASTFAFEESSASISASGANTDWTGAATGVFKRIPTVSGAFSISGITGGANGRFLILYNASGQNMTLTNDATSTAGNRILTCTGADSTSTGNSVAMLVYSSTDLRWILLNHWG